MSSHSPLQDPKVAPLEARLAGANGQPPSGTAVASRRRLPFRQAAEALRLPGFRRFAIAIFFFTAAMQIQIVAQGWLVFDITGSNLALGTVTSVWSITMVVFSPVGGVVADRLDRKLVLMLSWGGMVLVFAVLALLIFTDQIQVWHLVVAALLNGVLFAFNIPARFALLSQIVGDTILMGAMALISITFNFSGVVSPLLAGAIIDLLGAGGAYLLIALLYVGATAGAALIPSYPNALREGRRSVVGDLMLSIQAVRRSPPLAWLLLVALVGVVLGQPYGVLLPDFAANTLHVPAAGLGLLFTVIGLGALMGNLLVASLDSNVRLRRWMFVLGATSAIGLIWLALTNSIYPALASLLFLGFTGMPFFTINQTLVQLQVAPEMRGRIQSVYMLAWAAMPLGTMPLSAWADRVGISAPLLLSGAAMLACMLLVAWAYSSFPGLPRRPDAAQPQTKVA